VTNDESGPGMREPVAVDVADEAVGGGKGGGRAVSG
jgi:hypothetical protein